MEFYVFERVGFFLGAEAPLSCKPSKCSFSLSVTAKYFSPNLGGDLLGILFSKRELILGYSAIKVSKAVIQSL